MEKRQFSSVVFVNDGAKLRPDWSNRGMHGPDVLS